MDPQLGDITNAIPDKGDIADLVPDGENLYDFLDDLDKWLPDTDAKDYIPNNVRKKLGNLADDIADLMLLGYDKINAKVNTLTLGPTRFWITPSSILSFKVRQGIHEEPTSDLMSARKNINMKERTATTESSPGTERHACPGNGSDHLYADGDNCTMIGGNGKDYFYLDADATALIKDYRKKGKDIIRVDGYNRGQIKISTKSGNSLIKAGKKTLAKVVGVKNLKKDQLEYSGGANYRKADLSEADLISEIFAPAADL